MLVVGAQPLAMNEPPSVISCIECGGEAHLSSFLPEDEPVEPGTPLAYHCSDCMERLDVVWEES